MAAVTILLSLLLGSAVPSIAALSAAQWAIIAFNAVKAGPQVVGFIEALHNQIHSPQFQEWVRQNAIANGDYVIRVYPGNNNFSQ